MTHSLSLSVTFKNPHAGGRCSRVEAPSSGARLESQPHAHTSVMLRPPCQTILWPGKWLVYFGQRMGSHERSTKEYLPCW